MSYLRVCPTCQQEFHSKILQRVFCSPVCRRTKIIPVRACLTCGNEFSIDAKHKRHRYYCSKLCQGKSNSKNTTLQLAVYRKDNELFAQRMTYTLNGITWCATPCCYCGDPAQAEEHVLPVSAYHKLSTAGNVDIPDDLLRIVPTCHECNGLLGDKIFRSFEEKRLYAKAALAQRYHRILECPNWETQELDTLEGALQQWIASTQNSRDLIFERLRF